MINAVRTRPVAVAIDARDLQYYGGGVMNGGCNNGAIDHAVTLVGYDGGAWNIRNSWGAGWGEAGHFRLAHTGDNNGPYCVQLYGYIPTI